MNGAFRHINSVAFTANRVLRIARYAITAEIVRFGTHLEEGKVFFSANNGGGFCCNPKYIAIEMRNRKEFTDFVWSVKPNEADSLPEWVRPVTYGSRQEMLEMASAQVWIANTRGGKYLRKKKRQYYVQTWHGSLGPKMIEADAIEQLPKRYLLTGKREGNMTDLMFANNDLYMKVFTESFWYNGPVLRSGAPRNAPILLHADECKRKVGLAFEIDPRYKICLYAPTFRSGGRTGVFSFDYRGICDVLSRRFGGHFVFMIKLHPNLRDEDGCIQSDDIIDASRYVDCQELLAAADFLITDYSSVYEDFALTRRPACIFAPDYAEYISSERKLYYPLTDRPAPVATNEEELRVAIMTFDQEAYIASVNSFLSRYNYRDDGLGAKSVVDEIIKKLYS